MFRGNPVSTAGNMSAARRKWVSYIKTLMDEEDIRRDRRPNGPRGPCWKMIRKKLIEISEMKAC
jgi:hypothetical protein